ncbi:MAG: dissimilatory-type sulfite reductase subunit alpha [Archaeoglobaceae archaeon]
MSETPMLDDLEKGPFPSFVKELKKTAEGMEKTGSHYKGMARDVLGILEQAYKDGRTHWKHGGIVAVKGYGSGVIGRYSDMPETFPNVAHFHTVRVNQPASKFYTTKALRQICDIWEREGSGITNFHGSTGDMVLLGTWTEELQRLRDSLADDCDPPFDIGGSGSALRSPSACVGPARCEWACYDTLDMCYDFTVSFQDELHRPMWPYKFKFKFSGCPNDCVASKARSDFAIIGTWKDDIKVDQNEVKEYAKMMDIQSEVVDWCPTKCMQWDGNQLKIDNANCVRCMHCINKMPKALAPGDEKGATVLFGGKAPMVEGSVIGWVLIPWLSADKELKRPYDYLKDLAEELWEYWDENGKFRERTAEMAWRVGVSNLMRALDLEVTPYVIKEPRNNPFTFWAKDEVNYSDYVKKLEEKGAKWS